LKRGEEKTERSGVLRRDTLADRALADREDATLPGERLKRNSAASSSFSSRARLIVDELLDN
jgi:hypothetical protein